MEIVCKRSKWVLAAVVSWNVGVLPATGQTISLSSGGSDQIWDGVQSGSFSGQWLDQGDVGGGDSRRDLIVGAPGSATVPGAVYIIFGGPVRTGHNSLGAADVILSASAAGDRFGAATAAGNIFSTTLRNLAVGAPGAAAGRGMAYVFDAGFVGGSQLDASTARLQIIGASGDALGSALATADLDNDGYRELIVGAPGNNRVYVIRGGPTVSGTIDLATAPAPTIVTGTGIGRVLSAGDVSGDGIYDLLIGSPDANAVYVVAGGSMGSSVSLPEGASAVLTGQAGDRLGTSIRVADVDGARHANGMYTNEIVLGAPGSATGRVYVLWGEALASRAMSAADVVMVGPTGYQIGEIVASGDMNRDDPDDLLLVARSLDASQFSKLLVCYGRSLARWGAPQASGVRLLNLGAAGGVNLAFVADTVVAPMTSAVVFEVTGEGARDVILGVPEESGGTGRVYFALSPKLRIDLSDINLTLPEGQANTSAVVHVSNPSSVGITWQTDLTAPWLATSQRAGVAVSGAPGQFTVTTSSEGLLPGSYSAAAKVRSTSDHLFMTLPISVSLTVTEARYAALETPTGGSTLSQPFAVSGWAIDSGVPDGTGVDRVDIWAYPTVAGRPAMYLGTATYGAARPDVAAIYGERFANSGFTFTTRGVPNGSHQIVARAHSPVTGAFWTKPAASLAVTVRGIPSRADFNGDGKADIVWHNGRSGQLVAWQMDGAAQAAYSIISPAISPRTKIVGFADFNRDGKPDLLLHDQRRGDLSIWFLSGARRIAVARLRPGRLTPAWQVVAVGDFNGDGYPDLFWRYRNGMLRVWLMRGAVRIATVAVAPSVVSTLWNVAGAGDFNGDGRTDLLWRHRNGAMSVWFMFGTRMVRTAYLTPGTLPVQWELLAVADFNGDGWPDILWRDRGGNMVMWWMRETTRMDYSIVTPARLDPVWRLAGPR